jgi:hypothetical protein
MLQETLYRPAQNRRYKQFQFYFNNITRIVGWVRRSRNPTNLRMNVGLRDKAANPTYKNFPDMEME